MNEKIKQYVDSLFSQAPRTRRAEELKQELIANLLDKYDDLIKHGKDEETAYAIAISGIGDVDELIKNLREQDILDPASVQKMRQKSALMTSSAIGIYILSFIFPIIFSSAGRVLSTIGNVLMFLCWAFATALLVYNAMSKPKYVKIEDTLVEDFKEWKHEKNSKRALQNSLMSLIWMLSVIIFLAIGIFWNAWHPGWLIFLIAAVISQILRLLLIYKSGD